MSTNNKDILTKYLLTIDSMLKKRKRNKDLLALKKELLTLEKKSKEIKELQERILNFYQEEKRKQKELSLESQKIEHQEKCITAFLKKYYVDWSFYGTLLFILFIIYIITVYFVQKEELTITLKAVEGLSAIIIIIYGGYKAIKYIYIRQYIFKLLLDHIKDLNNGNIFTPIKEEKYSFLIHKADIYQIQQLMFCICNYNKTHSSHYKELIQTQEKMTNYNQE